MARTSNKTSSNPGTSILQDQMTDMIRKKAYELYEKRGKKQGRDMDNWLEPERIIKQRVQNTSNVRDKIVGHFGHFGEE